SSSCTSPPAAPAPTASTARSAAAGADRRARRYHGAMRSIAAWLLTTAFLLSAALPARATCGGGGGGGTGGMAPRGDMAEQVYQVPWKTSAPKDRPTQGLILYWFPASMEELKLSSLRTSRDLSLYAA